MNEEELPDGYTVIALDDAEARFGLAADLDVPYYRSVADDQQIRLYPGSVHIGGDLVVQDWVGDQLCPYNVIIDGDLSVDGDLVHSCDEGVGYFMLVTGAVRARNVLLSGFPHVAVRGDLTVTHGVLGRRGDDGGFLTVRGRVRAEAVVNTAYFTMTLDERPAAVLVSDPGYVNRAVDFRDRKLGKVLRRSLLVDYGPGDKGYCDDDAIWKSLREGQRILRKRIVRRQP